MSAIFGILRLDGGSVAPGDLQRMSDRLAHRGAQPADTWLSGPIGLGIRTRGNAARTIDHTESLVSDDATLAITGDIRIDNRSELIAALDLAAEESLSSDARLALAAYARWGHRCCERIVGDFAFAIWDERQRRLLCTRDPIGLRPLFYHHAPGKHFVFASEIQPLLTLSEVPRRLRPTRVAHYLLYAYEGKTATFYDEILRMPPGHTITITDRLIEPQRYWSPASVTPSTCRTDEEFAEAFRELFLEAVRCRLPADGLVGASFSGGLDSSSVVCTARHLRSRSNHTPLHTFTVTWPGAAEADERRFTDAVIAGGGIEPHYEPADRINPLFDFDRLPLSLDEPPDNPLAKAGWVMREQIAGTGIHVVLEGSGGDQTVSFAFSYLADMMRAGRCISAVREARALSRTFFEGSRTTRSVLKSFALLPLIPMSMRRTVRSLRDWYAGERSTFLVPMDEAFASRVGVKDLLRGYETKRSAARSADRFHSYVFEEELAASPLEAYEAANAAFGYESRCPFLDRRLVEFCLSLPRRQRIEDGLNRVIVRRALADLLPEPIRSRGGKGNANPAFAGALLAHGQAELRRVIVDDPGPIAPFIDVAALRRTHERFLAHGTTRDAYAVWTAVTLARWLVHSGLAT